MSRLVVLTKNYGYNFTGATMATQHFVERWSQVYSNVIVYTLHEGARFEKKNIIVKMYSSIVKLVCDLWHEEKYKTNTIYYSDDHFGFILGAIGKQYYHTYHGNWPDAARINLNFRLKSLYFIPLYYITLKKATCIINVSYYMKKITDRINSRSVVIRNGMDFKSSKFSNKNKSNKCLMVGNIDKRKYKKCLSLAEVIQARHSNLKIDIYGKILDRKLAEQLGSFSCIELKGLVRNVPYNSYDVFLNLSVIENLSISVCEAIANHIPVICFDVGGLKEVVKNNQTGYVITSGDIQDVYDAIIKLKYNPIDVNDSVLSAFDWDLSARKYLEIFKESKDGE